MRCNRGYFDIFDCKRFNLFLLHIVERDVLRGYRVAVLGSCPAETFRADVEAVGDFADGVLMLPGFLG